MDRPDRAESGACSWCGGEVCIVGVSEEYHAGLTVLCDRCYGAWESRALDDEGRWLPLAGEEVG